MSKQKTYKLTISTGDKLKASRAAKRIADIELGVAAPKHKVHRNRKAYDRRRDKKIEY